MTLEAHFGIKVSRADRTRLQPHLASWRRLNEVMLINGIAIEDIQRLIIIESKDRKRQFILDKLLGRLSSKQREEINCLLCPQKPRLKHA